MYWLYLTFRPWLHTLFLAIQIDAESLCVSQHATCWARNGHKSPTVHRGFVKVATKSTQASIAQATAGGGAKLVFNWRAGAVYPFQQHGGWRHHQHEQQNESASWQEKWQEKGQKGYFGKHAMMSHKERESKGAMCDVIYSIA
ncbi:unnamed protein product [Durusdinium trenchii]|uniref:Secreted protein n=1 Tax=Durusdinium trenchii TaxID=1381693 RepID=A0ABP0Q711_9DINO